jgi:hypothetical protein
MTATSLHHAPRRLAPRDHQPRADRPEDRVDRLRTALPVTLALVLLAGLTAAALWALHGLLAFGVWFLGAG